MSARRVRVRAGNGVVVRIRVRGNVLCPIFGLVGCKDKQEYYDSGDAHANKAIKEYLITRITICFSRWLLGCGRGLCLIANLACGCRLLGMSLALLNVSLIVGCWRGLCVIANLACGCGLRGESFVPLNVTLAKWANKRVG